MSTKSDQFLALHRPGAPLLLANAWSPGSAALLHELGFSALATTSAGHAGTLGRRDGGVSLDEALEHAAQIVAATPLPVSADLEDGFGDSPAAVAATMRRAAETGLAGASIEDYTRDPDDPIFGFDEAVARVQSAVEASGDLVITARCENHLRGRPDLDDTIARLQAYERVGAQVLYAPALRDLDDIRRVVEAVEAPLNVLALPDGPSVAELAGVGVARVSVGSRFFAQVTRELRRVAAAWRETGRLDAPR